MPKILVRYAEIGLKGKNLSFFENRLIKNVKKALGDNLIQIIKLRKQFVLSVSDKTKSLEKLTQVFGIAWFSPITVVKTDLNSITKAAIKLTGTPKTFALKVNRIEKSVSFSSQEVAIKVGNQVRLKSKAKVNLKNPEKSIFIDLYQDSTHLFIKKIPGPGGLPVNSSGKVLSLLSGGFDSIASSYLLAKRGAMVDLLHFHVFNDHQKIIDSKINTITDQLKKYTLSKKIFLASYTPFQLASLEIDSKLQKQELVVFRRLMVKVGQELAKKHGYQALVLGDSLGQVASQTMENIVAVDQAVDIPIFRPLIGMDKKDIIALVKKINLYDQAIKPYKDCCSLVSKTPATKANLEKVKIIEKDININQVIKTIIKKTDHIIL